MEVGRLRLRAQRVTPRWFQKLPSPHSEIFLTLGRSCAAARTGLYLLEITQSLLQRSTGRFRPGRTTLRIPGIGGGAIEWLAIPNSSSAIFSATSAPYKVAALR